MSNPALVFESISNLSAQIRAGQLSPVTCAEAMLRRIDALDGRLRSFIRVMPERALAQARAAESASKSGAELGPLHGIPYAAKDLFDVKGVPTMAGTHLLADNIAAQDSTVVRKLAAAGMVLLGKTHTVQFAYGAAGINHDHGTPHNPWHPMPHAPGGSSSGSAVAVAAGLAPMALGTDTGGSVRVPAALCGIVGLKTTVGRVSRAGVYPLCWTLDSVGPITRSVEDAAIVYQAMQGADARDDSTAGVTAHDALRGLKDGVKGLRIAFGETTFFDDVDSEIEKRRARDRISVPIVGCAGLEHRSARSGGSVGRGKTSSADRGGGVRGESRAARPTPRSTRSCDRAAHADRKNALCAGLLRAAATLRAASWGGAVDAARCGCADRTDHDGASAALGCNRHELRGLPRLQHEGSSQHRHRQHPQPLRAYPCPAVSPPTGCPSDS